MYLAQTEKSKNDKSLLRVLRFDDATDICNQLSKFLSIRDKKLSNRSHDRYIIASTLTAVKNFVLSKRLICC